MTKASIGAVRTSTLLLIAALLALLVSLNGCSAGPSDDNLYGLGACIADIGGDHCGAAWIDHYADTGDPGVDIVP